MKLDEPINSTLNEAYLESMIADNNPEIDEIRAKLDDLYDSFSENPRIKEI